jgi:hypothetical protein
MCTLIHTPEGETIQTVAGLRRMWPTIIEVNAGVLDPSEDEDYCLCGIDVDGSARVNHARVKYESDWDEYTILPCPPPRGADSAGGEHDGDADEAGDRP